MWRYLYANNNKKNTILAIRFIVWLITISLISTVSPQCTVVSAQETQNKEAAVQEDKVALSTDEAIDNQLQESEEVAKDALGVTDINTQIITKPVSDEQTELPSEVVRFSVQGKQIWQKLGIDDLDVLNKSEVRYLPILRLLNALDGKSTVDGDIINIKLENLSDAVLNTITKEFTRDNVTKTVDLIAAQSAVTGKRDFYLPPDIIAEIFSMDIKWDDETYTYLVNTDRKLALWSFAVSSLLGVQTTIVPIDLPEMLPPSVPGSTSLDFLRARFRLNASPFDDKNSSKISDDAPQLTAWGNLIGGRYKVEVETPSVSGSRLSSTSSNRNNTSITWVDWIYRTPNSEIIAGDSRFGFTDLVFPYTTMTGIRVNGFLSKGSSSKESMDDSFRSNFFKQRIFQGYAPVASKVEIFINDKLVDSEDVTISAPDAPSGMGLWKFEDIGLPAGRMSEVRIVITDSSGNKTQRRDSIYGTPLLLPAGKLAYSGAFGTHRDMKISNGGGGTLGGGRIQIGVNNNFTIGGAAAVFDGFFPDISQDIFGIDRQFYPRTGSNAGIDFAWMPFKPILLYGGAALSNMKEKDSGSAYSDNAYILKGEYFPSKSYKLNFQMFKYGPHYFNGQTLSLHDRQGYSVGANWNISPKFTMDASYGKVSSSESSTSEDVNIMHANLATSIFKDTSLSLSVDKLTPTDNTAGRVLSTLEMRSQVLSDITIYGLYSVGKTLINNNNINFFDGLSLPSLNLYDTPRSYYQIGKPITENQFLTLSYWSGNSRRRASVIHDIRAKQSNSMFSGFSMHTELGSDMDTRTAFIENRLEYTPGVNRDMRIGVTSRYDRGEWRMMLVMDKTELFGFFRGRPRRITSKSINPDIGAVQGTVFLDTNGNGKQDAGESGVSDIKVMSEDRFSANADKNGYFIMPVSSRVKKERIFLDMNSVPANFSPTNGIQTAFIKPCNITDITLGVSPVHSITGLILLDVSEDNLQPMKGIRVYLISKEDEKILSESITATDGSFYLSEIRPGKYYLQVDMKTLPEGYLMTDNKRDFEVPLKLEFQEIKVPPFEAVKK